MIDRGDDEPLADDRALATAVAPPATRRLRSLAALAGVLFAQALAAVLLSPFGVLTPGDLFGRFLLYSGAGIVLAQPMLLAIGTVFGPGRWLVRFPCGLAIIAILALLANFGSVLRGSGDPFNISVMVVAYLFLQTPLFGIRWWRRWRLVLPGAGTTFESRHLQFSLRWLLAVATGTCVMLAIGRWTYQSVQWPDTAAGWATLLVPVCLGALMIASVSLAAVALIGAGLGIAHRGLALGLAVGALVAAAALLFWLMPGDPDTPGIVACSLPAGWTWILLNLLVFRRAGYRLVREPRGAAAR